MLRVATSTLQAFAAGAAGNREEGTTLQHLQQYTSTKAHMTPSTPPPLHHPIQTIVTGTSTARIALDAGLSGAIRVREQCIVVDLPLLETLPQHKTARLIAVVKNAAELYKATRHNPPVLAIVAVCDLRESIRIRHAALHSLSAPGILFVRNGLRAREVLSGIIRAWRTGEGVERAWGEPFLDDDTDAVIPPTWDSDGKISAVLDAAGFNRNQVLQESSWGTVTHGGTVELGNEQEFKEEAAVHRTRARNKAQQWIKRLHLIGSAHDRRPSSGEAAAQGTATEQQQPKSDFFQRLLAERR